MAAATPAVGTTRTLIALDDYQGFYYPKSYTLQAVGAKVEVWVAARHVVPRRRLPQPGGGFDHGHPGPAQELADQFDSNMFPKESQAFSVAPTGTGAATRSRTSMPPVTATRS